MNTPTPWKKSDDAELRALMEHAAAEAPSAAQLAALSAGVKAGLAAGALASAGAGTTLAAKLISLVVASGLIVGGTVWWVARDNHGRRAPAHAPAPAHELARPPEPARSPEAAREPQPSGELAGKAESAQARAVRTRSPRPPRVVPAPVPAPVAEPDEPTLLMEARSALQSGALAAARSALSAHERAHPEGLFREEREALVIELLARTHDAALGPRVSAFMKRYPRSPYRERVARYTAAPR